MVYWYLACYGDWLSQAPVRVRRPRPPNSVRRRPIRGLLASGLSEQDGELIRSHERTGRPQGIPASVDRLERLLRRTLKPQKRSPKPKPNRASTRRQSDAGA